MNKKVIYSAVVGNYDEIRQPAVVSEEFDYILFSNDIMEERIGVWQVRPIHYTNPIQTKIARYVKTHPEELLSEYDYSVWIDSNVIIKDIEVYTIINSFISKGALIASIAHKYRHCIYEEMAKVLEYGWETEEVVDNWNAFLEKEQYPENNGLYETGVLFRAHKTDQVAEADKLWWWCIENYSRRDQLSFNYALWKNNIHAECFLEEGINVGNTPLFEVLQHQQTSKKNLPKTVSFDKLLYYAKRALTIRLHYLEQHGFSARDVHNAYAEFYLVAVAVAVAENNTLFINDAIKYFGNNQIDIQTHVNELKKLEEYKKGYIQIQASHAYRIGKFITRPFAWIKRIAKRK